MLLSKFNEKLINDDDLLLKIPHIKKHLHEQSTVEQIFELCRETYLTQFNSEIIRNEDNTFSCFTSNAAFARLGEQVKDFITELNENNKSDLFHEIVLVLEKYYIHTASPEETKSRVHTELNPNRNSGLFGTIYDFNKIDWDIFLDGLKSNIDLEL